MKKYLSSSTILFIILTLITAFVVNINAVKAQNAASPDKIEIKTRNQANLKIKRQEIEAQILKFQSEKVQADSRMKKEELKTQIQNKREEIQTEIKATREVAKQKMADLKEKIKEGKEIAKIKIEEARIVGREKALDRF